jgi:type VI secretion system secreted protein Hcp
MPFVAYMYVKSEKGVIKGFTGEEDKAADGKTFGDMSRVQSCNHSIRIPTHQQTGEAQGQGQHSPLMVTIELDRSVAELYKALTLNYRIDEVKVYFTRAGTGMRAGGKPTETMHNWFTVTIEDARLVGLDLRKSFAMEGSNVPDLLDVTFTYRKIKWEDHDDKKEAEYDWKKRG